MSGSPLPRYEVAFFDAERGEKWYVLTNPRDDDLDGPWSKESISGGPYASREEALAEVERRYEDMAAHYRWAEAEAKRLGYPIAW